MLLFFIVVVIPEHNLGNSQVSVNRTIGPTLVLQKFTETGRIIIHQSKLQCIGFNYFK